MFPHTRNHRDWVNCHAEVRGRSLAQRFRLLGTCPSVIVLCALVACLGCLRQEPAPSQRVQDNRPKPKPSNTPVSIPPAQGLLTAEQQEAVNRIAGAGGAVECDQNGFPTSIDLASDRVSANDTLVAAALQFPRLRSLRLSVTDTTPETLSGLASLGDLRELFLQDAPVSDDDLSRILAKMPALERLTLRRLSQVTAGIAGSLVELPKLEVLALIEMNQVSGATLEQLRGATELRSLDLRDCGGLSAEDLRKLVLLEQVSELKLGGPAINDDVLASVAQHPSMTSLVIENAQVTAACLQRLADVPVLASRLRNLSLTRCFGVTDDSLVLLGKFPQLETLVLRDILVTGTFLQQLSESAEGPLPLKTLIITKGFVDDAALQTLPSVFPQLTRLDLRGNVSVTDKSLDVFRRLPDLRELQLEGTQVSKPGDVLSNE